MPDRTPSEKIWADLESQLSAMDHAQLVRICAHLIRTYIVEDPRTTAAAPVTSASAQSATPQQPSVPAETQPKASTPSAVTSPFGGPKPKSPASEPPREKPKQKEPGYNKLEMD